jgi:Fungal Zn(2)-Cys(6) binuclear cluster domain/Fungal specific transcription factor domain
MEESLGPQAHHESQSLTDRQVDGLLLSSKKIRYRNRKACYPCNKRKIKCDRDEQPNGQPCSNCRKRPHPELCSYEDSNPRSSGGSTRSTAHTSQPATPNQQAGRQVQGQPLLSSTHTTSTHTTSTGHATDRPYPQDHDPATTYSPYYGDNDASHASTPYSAKASVSPFAGQGLAPQMNYQTARYDANLPTRAAPPVFAQPSSSTTSLPQHPTSLRDEINPLLPPQKHILPYLKHSFSFFNLKLISHRYFEVYRTFCAPINPIILELDDFEANVCNHVVGLANGQLLHNIISSDGRNQEVILTQLAQLLATIASGIQYSDVPHAERSRLLQEYSQHPFFWFPGLPLCPLTMKIAKNSFRCLRLANFLLRPSFISIQTVLLLATVLQNGLLPEAAWTLLNTTKALAQSLGLGASRSPGANGYSDVHPGLELWYERLSISRVVVDVFTGLLVLGRRLTSRPASGDSLLGYVSSMRHLKLRH